MKGLNKQICLFHSSGRFILWQPINLEILACSNYFILLLSSYIFWIRNKQKQRITWKQMHWFLVEQSFTTYIYINKLSFHYFYCDEIYLLQESFHESLYETKMISEMENGKFESHRHTYTSLLCYPISFLE